MFLINFTVVLSMLTILTAARIEPANISVQLVTSADMTKLLQEYPDAQPLTFQILPEEISKGSVELKVPGYNGVYAIGARATGDSLVFSAKADNSFPTPQNVIFDATYPPSGVGALLTYVEMKVGENGNARRGYIVNGGIGSRFMRFIVEVANTLVFNYDLKFYGTP